MRVRFFPFVRAKLSTVLRPRLLSLVCWLVDSTAHYDDGVVWMPDPDLSADERGEVRVELKKLGEDVCAVALMFAIAVSYFGAGYFFQSGEPRVFTVGAFLLMFSAFLVWLAARDIDPPEIRTAGEVDR
jgi:hypothetical protein